MAAPSTAFTYSPPAVSPTFPDNVTSTPPQSGPEELEPAPPRERRSSQKRASAATGYPSTTTTAPLAPLALSPGPPRAAPPATTTTTRPLFAYDPSLVIPPFNPNKRRGANPPSAADSTSSAPAPSSSSRRDSAQAALPAAPPAPTHFSAQQQQHYQQQWAQLVQHQQAQQIALVQAQLADRARQQLAGTTLPAAAAAGRIGVAPYVPTHPHPQQQQQRPVSVMPAMPGRHPAQHPSAGQDASLYAPYYPSGSAGAPPVSGPGGSVSSRVRQSVGYLPVGAPSSGHAGVGAGGGQAGPGTPGLGSGGPYPHLYTPHPMPRQKVYFGPYVLLQTLGEGEFGKVKLGVHGERWGEDVAIKLIKRGNVDTAQRGEKVRREIEVLKMVRHPNIVRLYDVIETEKYIGIVLEYASGGELFDHILAHRYLKERDASRLFAQLVSGVSYLHAKGVVHRDLKLENLLLDRNRNVIITDFGFANRFNDARADLMATSCGSPCYAAPELVVSEGKYVGTAVDVWSCGVILYAMLAGYLPYDDDPLNPDGDNINLLYRYILSTPLTFPDWITDEPRGLLLDMLVADPHKRCTITDVTRHSWLRRYAPAFDKSVAELEFQAQEMERHKRQALEVQRQWLVAQQQQQALAAQGLLAPSMTRSQTATSGMGGPLGAPLPGPFAASLGPGGAPAVGRQRIVPRPGGETPQMVDPEQRRADRTVMVPSASTSAVSSAASAPLPQEGFEHYSLAQPAPSVAAPSVQQQQAPPSSLADPGMPISPGAAPASPPATSVTTSTAASAPALVPLVVPEPPISPRTRTTSTGIVPVPHPSNPNRRSGAYTVSSSPPTTQTEFASAEAGPFSFAAVASATAPAPTSVPMATSLSAPAAPSRSSSGGTANGGFGDGNGALETLNEDALMRDRTPTGSAASSRRPSTSVDEDEAAAAQRRRKAAYRATLQVEYDGAAAAASSAPRRRGASREPGLATAVEGLGIDTAPSLPPLPPAVPLSLGGDKDQLEVPGGAGHGAPSPTPSDGAVSVSTTTETHQGEDVVMQSVEEEEPTVTLPAPAKEAPLPPLVLPFPAPTTTDIDTPTSPPRKRKSSGSPATSIHPAEIPLPPTPATATPTSEAPEPAAPLRTQPKTSTSSQTSQPARPPSASSNASRHRHTASADRFSLRSLLGASSNAPQPASSATSRPPVLAPAVPPVPPLPAKDAPLDEVTNRRKSTRRQKAMSLQPFRHSVSSKLPKGARQNVESAVAASVAAGSGAAAGRERASTVHAQGETIQPGQAAVPVVPPKQPSRPPSSSRADSGSLASHKRFSADLEANWGTSSSSSPSGAAGPTPSGKAKAVMDWFRRKSSRNEGQAQALAPIKVDFDRSPLPTTPATTTATAGPAFAPRRSTSAVKPDLPPSSTTSMRDGTPAVTVSTPAPAPQDSVSNPSVVVTQPLAAAPQVEQPQQHDSALASQISDRRASTLNSSVGSSIGGGSAQQQQQQPVIFASPPAFAPTKLRFHQGALDKNAVTYRAPTDVLADIKQVLWSMGVDMSMEGDYKIKCVRKSRKKALASSVGPGAAAPASNGSAPTTVLPSSTAQDRRGSLVSTTSMTQSPSMGFRSLFGKKPHQAGGSTTPSSPNFSVPGTPSAQDPHSVDPLSSPMTTSVSQFSMLSLSSPQPLPVYGGDKSADAGDEVRFVVELTRVKNLDRLYCVDMKRMKGMAWSYKHVYDQLLASLELGPSI